MGTAQALSSIYVINLDRSADRMRRFADRNCHLKNVVRAPAVDGSRLNRADLIASGRFLDNLPYAQGTLGSALSHINLWEMSASDDRSITVFEDDIVAHYDFQERASALVAAMPNDWDIIHWAYWISDTNLSFWVDLGITRCRVEAYGPFPWRNEAGYREFQNCLISAVAPVRLIHCYGLLAYSISPNGARTALDHCLPLRARKVVLEKWLKEDDALDVAMCDLYPKIKAFISIPQLAIPSFGDSIRATMDKD